MSDEQEIILLWPKTRYVKYSIIELEMCELFREKIMGTNNNELLKKQFCSNGQSYSWTDWVKFAITISGKALANSVSSTVISLIYWLIFPSTKKSQFLLNNYRKQDSNIDTSTGT